MTLMFERAQSIAQHAHAITHGLAQPFDPETARLERALLVQTLRPLLADESDPAGAAVRLPGTAWEVRADGTVHAPWWWTAKAPPDGGPPYVERCPPPLPWPTLEALRDAIRHDGQNAPIASLVAGATLGIALTVVGSIATLPPGVAGPVLIGVGLGLVGVAAATATPWLRHIVSTAREYTPVLATVTPAEHEALTARLLAHAEYAVAAMTARSAPPAPPAVAPQDVTAHRTLEPTATGVPRTLATPVAAPDARAAGAPDRPRRSDPQR